jgi:dienelactone hydrolase
VIQTYRHLGPFSDLAEAAQCSRPLFPLAPPGPETQQAVRDALAFAPGPETPQDVRIEQEWERGGVAGQAISWSVGYGPRTEAWLLRPADAGDTPLPGVVALHDHGGYKYFGKEKIAHGPDGALPVLADFRERCYGGRAYANELARAGFAVLVPDTFLWGSRKFPPELLAGEAGGAEESVEASIATYNSCAGQHEHTVEKYCRVLGTTLSGVISYEDRVAVEYLASRPDVKQDALGCVGLSGGGLRAGLLQGTCARIRASVVVGMMSTYEGLLDHNIVSHTWMLYPGHWSRTGDWPDLVACRAPSPLLVQYDEQDGLFTPEGMQAADRRLAAHYESVGAAQNYVGQFYPGPHKFDVPMQETAFAWLAERLGA